MTAITSPIASPRAMKFPRALRKRMLEMSRAFPDGDFKAIATPDGPVVIGSRRIFKVLKIAEESERALIGSLVGMMKGGFNG